MNDMRIACSWCAIFSVRLFDKITDFAQKPVSEPLKFLFLLCFFEDYFRTKIEKEKKKSIFILYFLSITARKGYEKY